MTEHVCCECRKSEREVTLSICRVCHKYFCDDHAVQRSGASFCSLGCGQYFFSVDPDEVDE